MVQLAVLLLNTSDSEDKAKQRDYSRVKETGFESGGRGHGQGPQVAS
jgi:hypothetical protein